MNAVTRLHLEPLTKPQTPREWVALAHLLVSGIDTSMVDLRNWRASPPRDMDEWARKDGWTALGGCGTRACAGGHLVNHPVFQAAGLRYNTGDGPILVTAEGKTIIGATALGRVMGLTVEESFWLFGATLPCERVAFHDKHGRTPTEKEVFLTRCEEYLAGNKPARW